VENGALRIEVDEIDALPSLFMTSLGNTASDSLTLIETKKEDQYKLYQNGSTKIVSKDFLREHWTGIVFLIERDTEETSQKFQFTLKHLLIACCGISFGYFVFTNTTIIPFAIFLVTIICGLLLSVVALKNVFQLEHTFLNAICTGTENSSCNSVIKSSKRLSILSDVSLIFFAYQFLMLLISSATNTFQLFLSIQKVLLLASIPVLAISLYHQTFTVKKLCPVCLAIGTIVILEMSYLFTNTTLISLEQIPIAQYNFHFFIGIALALGWYVSKTIVLNNNTLYREMILANRFKRNYTLFKNTLISKSKTATPPAYLHFGNPTAPLTLYFITSPFCGFCEKPLEILQSLLQKYEQMMSVRLVYNVNFKTHTDDAKKLLQHLYYIQQDQGENAFFEALNFWYAHKDFQQWFAQYAHVFDKTSIQEKLELQRTWCVQNGISFTPALFINNYFLDKPYAIEDLN
jgi:thiol-disulfide isomerase/thioredoxin